MKASMCNIVLALTLVTKIAMASDSNQLLMSRSETLKKIPAVGMKKEISKQIATEEDKARLPLELKLLPKVLDSKTIQYYKERNQKIDTINLKKLYGPGAGGGGNICAFNITLATKMILKNVSLITGLVDDRKMLQNFYQAISTSQFLSGANLVLRSESKNAINYPESHVIVVDEVACDKISKQDAEGISFLLHEYLGLAKIDDTRFSVSGQFASRISAILPKEDSCKSDGCVARKNARTKALLAWIYENDDCINGVSWLQSLKKIDDSKYEVVCGDSTDKNFLILQTTPINSYEDEFKVELLNTK